MARLEGVVVVPGRAAVRARARHEAWTWVATFGALWLVYFLGGVSGQVVLTVLAILGCLFAPFALLMRDPSRRAAQRWMASPAEKTEEGRLRIEGAKLALEIGERRFEGERSELRDGFVEPLGPNLAALVLRFRDGELWTLRDVPLATGEELLAELGIGPEKRVARMNLAAASSRSFAAEAFGVFGPVFSLLTIALTVAVIFAMAVRHELAPLPVNLAALGGLAAFVASMAVRRPPIVEVGREGIRVRSPFRTRTISFADVTSIEGTRRGVALQLRGGRSHELVVTTRIGGESMEAARGALEARIRSALAQYGLTHGAPLELLARGEKPLEEWLASLRELGGAEGSGYRTASLDRDTLATAMEDPAVKPRLRIAAAVALMATPSDETRARIADASRATIDDELREALEAAAEDRAEDGLAHAARLAG